MPILSEANFKELFDLYFENIKSFIYYKIGDIDVAEDIAQESYIKFWEAREKIILETAKTYLYTIANNLALNYIKHNKVVLQFEQRQNKKDGESETNPEFKMELNEFQNTLEKTINQLPDKSREVFLMNRMDGLTYSEISNRLDVSVKAIEKRMSKALSILRKNLNVSI
ncbi:RNA polymerase sigma-70 factor [Flammeovirga sp. SR4]|uniref:RNA polymerase sigma-70 factor n=1 Tax=Flammeovirga agarivorans TaxID=2726742 RepID=A0A7X8SN05_9BACT|nr:RNA polymerase sigma-70 factor [Flammeovirga agarivorans]